MVQTYAKIKNGVVVNTQLLSETDYQDPTYVWVVIDGIQASDGSWVQIGYTYDGTNFSPP